MDNEWIFKNCYWFENWSGVRQIHCSTILMPQVLSTDVSAILSRLILIPCCWERDLGSVWDKNHVCSELQATDVKILIFIISECFHYQEHRCSCLFTLHPDVKPRSFNYVFCWLLRQKKTRNWKCCRGWRRVSLCFPVRSTDVRSWRQCTSTVVEGFRLYAWL